MAKIALSVAIAILILGGALYFSRSNSFSTANNVDNKTSQTVYASTSIDFYGNGSKQLIELVCESFGKGSDCNLVLKNGQNNVVIETDSVGNGSFEGSGGVKLIPLDLNKDGKQELLAQYQMDGTGAFHWEHFFAVVNGKVKEFSEADFGMPPRDGRLFYDNYQLTPVGFIFLDNSYNEGLMLSFEKSPKTATDYERIGRVYFGFDGQKIISLHKIEQCAVGVSGTNQPVCGPWTN